MTLFAPRSIVGDQWQPSSRVRSHRVADRSDDCKRVRLAQILDTLECTVLLACSRCVARRRRAGWEADWTWESAVTACVDVAGSNRVRTIPALQVFDAIELLLKGIAGARFEPATFFGSGRDGHHGKRGRSSDLFETAGRILVQ